MDQPRIEHTNRLIEESSPYLLQHAHNPVDWYPWSSEAFEKARDENKPVFLSIGYSSCHWCHVMERESFEDQEIADLLNEHFVSVKVDREERPDLDDVYMLATQLMTGSGGWPMSLFVTPDGKPFYAGTYFPRQHLRAVLTQIAGLYSSGREEIQENADRIAEELRKVVTSQFEPGPVPAQDVVTGAVDGLGCRFDKQHGGFSQKPKFPPYNDLRLLAAYYRQTSDQPVLEMITRTLDEMALGGIRDHLGGGFHRYSTDERWLLPHFEKMLYDNALLARSYAEAWELTKNDQYRAVATEILDWALGEMRDEQGMFFSAVDADSEGEEGKHYVWTRDEVMRVLGPELGELFCRVYNITPEGNYSDEASGTRTGANVVHLTKPLSQLSGEMGLPDIDDRMAEARSKLLAARQQRPAPAVDDKVLTGWNGLMIGSLAYCGRVLGEHRFVEAAEAAANALLSNLWTDRLYHRYRRGELGSGAYLDDYAFLANALLDLYDATGNAEWLEAARRLVDAMLEAFYDPADGGFFSTANDSEQLLVRLKDAHDSAVPSGNGAAAEALLRLHPLTDDERYEEKAVRTFEAFSRAIASSPAFTPTLVRAVADYYSPARAGA